MVTVKVCSRARALSIETPEDLATIQNCLGLTDLERLQGAPGKNLKKAINYLNLALNFYKKQDLRSTAIYSAKNYHFQDIATIHSAVA